MLILVHFLIWSNIVVCHKAENIFFYLCLFSHQIGLVNEDNLINCAEIQEKKNLKREEKKLLKSFIMKVNEIKKSLKQINAVLRNKVVSAKLHKLF